jgi:YegS/Rv2252/BmrU family lipid kinase
MKFKHIHFIINPSSGKEEPILTYINRAFDRSNTKWDVSVTQRDKGPGDIAKKLIGKTDLVVVYGGDGCVTDTAAALHLSNTPMAIIPGGTANVMAKELAIPLDTIVALELLKSKHRLKAIDMGLVNGHPFLLRVNLGIMADMILQAGRKLKDNIGQLAYGVTAIKTIVNAAPVKYKLEIDGTMIEETAVSLTITNSGNIGIAGLDMLPGISITDGLLDVILMRDNNLSSVLKVAGSTLLQNNTEALKHWRCKNIVVYMDAKQAFIRDDCEQKAKKLTINVLPAAINILVPR